MKRLIFCLLTIIFSAGISLAGNSPSGICNEKKQFTGDQFFTEVKPKSFIIEGLYIWLPDNWQFNNSTDELMAISPDNTACVLMKSIDMKSIDPGIPDFENLGERFMEEFKTTHKVTLLKSIVVPTGIWAGTDVPFDWKKLAFVPDKSTIRLSGQFELKLITIEGVGKISASERWSGITLIGMPNGRVLLLFSVSGMEKATVDENRQVFGKIIRSLKPQ